MRIVSCTRAEAERQLTDLALGWWHLDNQDRRAEALEALIKVRLGRREVTAGHTQFRIQEAPAS